MWLLLSSSSLSRWRLRPDGELHRGAASRVLVLLRQGPVSPGASSANLRGDACSPCVRGLARGAVRGALPPLLSPGKPQASVSLGLGLLPALLPSRPPFCSKGALLGGSVVFRPSCLPACLGLVRSCLPSGSVCLACLAFAPPRPSMSPCASDWWGWEVVASSNTPLARSHTLLMNFLCRHTSLLLGIFVFGSFLKLRAFYDAVRDPTSALRSAPVGPRAPVRQSVHQPLPPPLPAPGVCGMVLPFPSSC